MLPFPRSKSKVIHVTGAGNVAPDGHRQRHRLRLAGCVVELGLLRFRKGSHGKGKRIAHPQRRPDPEVIQIGRHRLVDLNPHPEAVPRRAVQDQGPGLPVLHLSRVGQFLLLLDDGFQTLVIEEDPPDLSQIGPIQEERDAGSPLTTQRNR